MIPTLNNLPLIFQIYRIQAAEVQSSKSGYFESLLYSGYLLPETIFYLFVFALCGVILSGGGFVLKRYVQSRFRRVLLSRFRSLLKRRNIAITKKPTDRADGHLNHRHIHAIGQLMHYNLSNFNAGLITTDKFVQLQKSANQQLIKYGGRFLSVASSNEIELKMLRLDSLCADLIQKSLNYCALHDVEFKQKVHPKIKLLCHGPFMKEMLGYLVDFNFHQSGLKSLVFSASVIDGQIRLTTVAKYHISDNNMSSLDANLQNNLFNIIVMYAELQLGAVVVNKGAVDSFTQVEVTIGFNCSAEHLTLADDALLSSSSDTSSSDISSSDISSPDTPKVSRHGVLVVAQQNRTLDYMAGLLSHQYIVNRCQSDDDIVQQVIAFNPQVVVLDSNESMLAWVRSLRRNDLTCRVAIISVSGIYDVSRRIRDFDAGVDEHLVLPINQAHLYSRVKNLLARTNVHQIHKLQGQLQQAQVQQGSLQQSNDEKLVDNYIQFVREHFADASLQSQIIAERLFVTKKQLERKVKDILSVTPNQYLVNYRLEYSKTLLAKGVKVQDIFDRCGFSSHAYFSKKFKQKYQCTPTEWLNQLPNSNNDSVD